MECPKRAVMRAAEASALGFARVRRLVALLRTNHGARLVLTAGGWGATVRLPLSLAAADLRKLTAETITIDHEPWNSPDSQLHKSPRTLWHFVFLLHLRFRSARG